MKKFALIALISLVTLVVVLNGVIVDTSEGRRVFFIIIGAIEGAVSIATVLGALFEEEEKRAIYGLAWRNSNEYVIVEDDSIIAALAQAKVDAEAAVAAAVTADEAAVAEAEAKAWRDLMVTHAISAAALLSLDYDLIRGLGLKLFVEYNAAGKPVVRVR